MNYDALIVIDMQTALVGRHPYNEVGVLRAIGELVLDCRKASVPVLYVRHDGGQGDELEAGTAGWEICVCIAPERGEEVFDKRFNSAFRQTGLHEYLQQRGMHRLLMCGMQTEFCFDVSAKVAFEYGYEVVIPRGLVTTFESDFATGEALNSYYEDKIWDGRYASVLPLSDVLADCR